MDRTRLLYIVDMLLALSFLSVALTGIAKWPGLWYGLGLSLPIIQLSKVHEWSGMAMMVMVFVHLALHRRWIVCTTKNIFRKDKRECEMPQ
ncbi:MAG: DUF4405 domain-containing protein [Nanoarchaeota archaeon]